MIAPTTQEIRSWSRSDFASKDYPEGTPDPLDIVVTRANAWMTFVTGRVWATMPPPLEAIAGQVAQMRVEQIVEQLGPDAIETAGDIDLIASFTAGAYSETRRDPEAMAVKSGLMLNPWPALNELLWALLGTTSQYPDSAVDERYAYWLALLSGVQAPAWQIIEVDWSGMGDAALDRIGIGY